MRTMRSTWRSAMVLGLLLAAIGDGIFRKLLLGMTPGPAGAVWVHGWCRRIVWALGLELELDGPLPAAGERGLAVVSNHLSYLDILLYSAVRPFVMVSKTEVRGWPLLGWITAQAGTIYVQRADVKGGQTQTHAQVNLWMAEAYRSGLPVLFFPEGTTTDGESGVLGFRRGLFNSVVYDDVPVRTATVAYAVEQQGARVCDDVCFWGEMDLAPHLFNFLGLRGVRVAMRFGDEDVCGEDRFALAAGAREEIAEAYVAMCAGLAWQQVSAAERGENLLDGPVEGFGSVDDEVCVGG